MIKYKKKPIVIEAEQWFGVEKDKILGNYKLSVGYFRHPEVVGESICQNCKSTMHHHGFMDTLEGGHKVCPGDWIIKGINGEMYPCKPDIFEKTYDEVLEK